MAKCELPKLKMRVRFPQAASRNIFILFLIIIFMSVVIPLLIVAVAITAIWLIIEFKRFRHKLLLIFLIVTILSIYISFTWVLRNNNVDLTTLSGIKEASKFYFSWLGSVFGNFKTITSNAVKLDWGINENTSLKKVENNTVIK